MIRNQGLKFAVGVLALVGIGVLLFWAFREGPRKKEVESEDEHPAPSRVSALEVENAVTLDEEARTRAGVEVASLTGISYRQEVKAFGTILDLQGLIDLRNGYATARAGAEKGRAGLEASRRAYERVKTLHDDDRNASDRALQEAEAAWRSDRAEAQAAQEALQSAEGTAQQHWGGTLAHWLADGGPALDRLMRQEEGLIQATLPAGVRIPSAPDTALIQAADGTRVAATLVSPAPRTDPRLQGMSFFYRAPVAMGLLPGMNAVAYLPVGPMTQGVIVPAPAVIWWQGKAWVYAQKDPTHFVRREVSTETPAGEGWFVSSGMSAGDRIVVSGAQTLLSEEFRSQIQGED